MGGKHGCRKFGSPSNQIGHSTDDANHGRDGFEFIHLHVVTKNLQSIKSDDRFHDFIAEIDKCCFDIFFFSETWRVETEEVFMTPVGHKLFFSGDDGGSGHQGVGVAIHKRLLHQIDSISFSAFSSRVCQLQLSWGTTCFRCIAVYFPTSWHSEDDVEHVYSLLDLLLDACVKDGCIPILGGDFNACIGPLENHEAMDQIGHWGSGMQNERGRILMRFVLAKGLQICNRQSTTENMEASWTCCRTLDSTCVLLDYILANFRLQTVEVWNDFALPIGLDHRCANCILRFQRCSRPRMRQQRGLKRWQPTLDSNGLPAKFHNILRMNKVRGLHNSLEGLERSLRDAGQQGGNRENTYLRFQPSDGLKRLRAERRATRDTQLRKSLTFSIRKNHRQEIRAWKTERLNAQLGRAKNWQTLRKMQFATTGTRQQQMPQPNAFAHMLGETFAGNPHRPCRPPNLTENPWTLHELQCAVRRTKIHKGADEAGLVAELLKNSSDDFQEDLLRLFNDILYTGNFPPCWSKTLFQMLAKKARAQQPSDFRPIANIRLLYKTFAFMILARIEASLEAHQPEEQHGFRKHRRKDEHLLTATLFLDKAWDKGIPVWIVSLDLSKAFDRVNWDALWLALHDHGISEHLVWILQLIYSNQSGEVQGEHSNSDLFPIHAGVRQGCVLSPRLFCSVLQWGMSAWRRNAETKGCGFDLGDTMPSLLDLRFADDILLFARTAAEAMALLDDLVRKLQNIGLQLNAAKTVVLTSEVQPPSSLHMNNGTVLRVLKQEEAHKWLGCMISAAGSRNTHLDLQHHLQAASRAFHANKWILCDKGVSILHRLRYFDKVVSPVACFGASHRAIHKDDLAKLDVEYRRLMRMVVGPPADTNWASPWHDILHGWNNRVQILSDHAGLQPWSVTCIEAVWKFASYVAILPPERWTRRILAWNMRGPRKRGRPAYTWETALQMYSIWKGFDDWIMEAAARERWMLMKRDFVVFTLHNR